MKKLKAIATAISLAVISALTLSGCGISLGIGDEKIEFGSTYHYEYANSDKYSAGDMETTDDIDTLNIDYVSGDLNISGSDTDSVTVKETSNVALEEDYKVHTWVDGNVLYIRFCASKNGLNFNNIQKKLEITLPGDKTIEDLKIEMSSGDVYCNDMAFKNIESGSSSGNQNFNCEADTVKINTTSGSLKLDLNGNCDSVKADATSGDLWLTLQGDCKTIDAETTSGDITLNQAGEADSVSLSSTSGNLGSNVGSVAKMNADSTSGVISVNGKCIKDIEADSTSGGCKLVFEQVPVNAKIDSTSGNIDVKIPDNSDISVTVETSSGDFNYDFSFSKQGDTYVSGNGTARMDISATSGDVNLGKI